MICIVSMLRVEEPAWWVVVHIAVRVPRHPEFVAGKEMFPRP